MKLHLACFLYVTLQICHGHFMHRPGSDVGENRNDAPAADVYKRQVLAVSKEQAGEIAAYINEKTEDTACILGEIVKGEGVILA